MIVAGGAIRGRVCVLHATATVLIGFTPTAAQIETRLLRASEACAGCTVQLVKVISLTDSLHPGLFGYLPVVARDGRGWWYTASTDEGLRQVGVFDAVGGFRQALGREGKGPGEFTSINEVVVGAGDTLYVYDNALIRRTVYDPQHRMVQTHPLPGRVYDVAQLPGGRSVISANIPMSFPVLSSTEATV